MKPVHWKTVYKIFNKIRKKFRPLISMVLARKINNVHIPFLTLGPLLGPRITNDVLIPWDYNIKSIGYIIIWPNANRCSSRLAEKG